MRFKFILIPAILLLIPALLAWTGPNPQTSSDQPLTITMDDSPGATAFKAAVCNACHSVTAKGIARTDEVDPEAEIQPPDLSGYSAKSRTDEWLTGWLTKRITIEGRKHPKKWRGEAANLAAMIAWLRAL